MLCFSKSWLVSLVDTVDNPLIIPYSFRLLNSRQPNQSLGEVGWFTFLIIPQGTRKHIHLEFVRGLGEMLVPRRVANKKSNSTSRRKWTGNYEVFGSGHYMINPNNALLSREIPKIHRTYAFFDPLPKWVPFNDPDPCFGCVKCPKL